jgi:hypothetical protein
VAARCAGRFIHIDPREFHSPGILCGQFVQNRCQTTAVTSPGGREFEEDCSGKAGNFRVEVSIRDIDRPVRVESCEFESCAAFAAHSPASPATSRYPVLCSALRATDDEILNSHSAHNISPTSPFCKPVQQRPHRHTYCLLPVPNMLIINTESAIIQMYCLLLFIDSGGAP